MGVYSSTRRKLNQHWVRPRYVNQDNGNGFKSLEPGEKKLYHSLARDLFRSGNTIRSAITRKNSWAAASGWERYFTGQDKDFGKLAIEYLNNNIDQCNTAGNNYTFNRTLTTIANEIDVGGDCLVMFVEGKDGILRMCLYPSNVIGQRSFGEQSVSSGRYIGKDIFDGVVYDSSNSPAPIAYAILQDDQEDDYFVSATDAQLLFEPDESSMFRGISCIVSSLFQFLTQQDIEDYLSRTIKLQSKMGVIAATEAANGKEFVDGYTLGSSEALNATAGEGVKLEPVITDFGDYIFIDSKNNESLKSFEPKQPGTNVADWQKNIEEKCLYGLGWHLALISPNSIGSYAARIMESQVQQLIAARQQTLKRIAKVYCLTIIARGIDSGELAEPKIKNDWRQIDFHMPPEFQIDSYYGAQTSMQQWEMGSDSLQNISAKAGKDWIALRNQRAIEADDLMARATVLQAKYPTVSLERCMDLISKQTVNAAPVQQLPVPDKAA